MTTPKSEEVQSVSPADVWENLSPEQQAQITDMLARMIYKLASARAKVFTEEPHDGQRHDRVIEVNGKGKKL
jgi:hypothetical protein